MNDAEKIEQIASQLKREKQRHNRLELNLSFQREQLRKADIRRKIQLGGLVVKAELSDESAALLFGIMLEAKEKLDPEKNKKNKQYREVWIKRGDAAFEEHKKQEAAKNKKSPPA
jgi:hypothetical protein